MFESGRFFKAVMDPRLKKLTWLFSSIVIGASLASAFPMLLSSRACSDCCPAAAVNFGGAAIILFAAALLWSCWALAPKGYFVGPGLVTVARPIKPVLIPLGPGTIVEAAAGDLLSGSLRTMGNGGLFGYYGRFWKHGLGNYYLYATRSDGFVMIDDGKKKYFLTPEDPEIFIEEARRCKPGA